MDMMIRGRMHVTSVVFSKISRLFSITSYKRGRRPWPSYVSLHFSCTLLPAWLTLRGVSLSLCVPSIQQATQASTTRLGYGGVCAPPVRDGRVALLAQSRRMCTRLLETHARALRISGAPHILLYLRKAGYFFSLQRAERGVGLFFCACVRVPSGQRMARLPMRCYMMVFSSAGREY
jgi:hypothetical protein